jgi:hypothetical protein
MFVKPGLIAIGVLALAPLGFFAGSTAAQGRGQMPQQMPMYDVKTETTLAGTVEEVKVIDQMMGGGRGRGAGMGMGGTHLVLKTGDERIEVHLGPSAFLKERGIEIAQGDAVEVVGSRVTIEGSEALIARELRKGETSLTLRDSSGRPVWSGMGRR